MLDSLALLLEKAFLLAHFDIFSVLLSSEEKDRKVENAAEVERERRLQQQRLRRGDLLEVPRTLFIHFGIYLGDGKVAHLIPDILPALTSDEHRIGRVVSNNRLLLGVLYKCATIRVDTLEDFAYGSPVLLNTMDDALRTRPLANEEVALRAEKLIGRIPYSLLWNNCEHFVTYCRYGTGVSLQTDKFCECLKSIIRDQRSVLVATVLGVCCMLFMGLSPSTALPTLLILFILWMAG
ncbi:lecithin retinol acyltransferase-like [Colossoma macropomum]|uniref:lecithin retinol acyltransferase-like n=1 Tax=Colossoma macropomum TaxID=42526 RepID=UPI0018653F88|nr:lecithin retinol acyltransferase-like [Colossoma macropomum]